MNVGHHSSLSFDPGQVGLIAGGIIVSESILTDVLTRIGISTFSKAEEDLL